MNKTHPSQASGFRQAAALAMVALLVLVTITSAMSQGAAPSSRSSTDRQSTAARQSAMTETELLVLEAGVRAVVAASIPCTFTGSDGRYAFECVPAAGHFNRGRIERFEDEDEAVAAFQEAAGEHPRTCIHGYEAAEWEHSEGTEPGMPMRFREHVSAAGRWLFAFLAFDDTPIAIAVGPHDLAEAVYSAAAREGLFPLGECPPPTETATPPEATPTLEAPPEPTETPPFEATATSTVEPTHGPTPTASRTPQATEEATVTATTTAAPTEGPPPTETAEPTPGPSPTATESPPGDIELHGLVYGAGEPPLPLADAVVSVTMCVPRVFSERTGADGQYRLLIPAEYANICQTVTLSATAAGYVPASQTESIAALRESPNRNFVLTPGRWPLYLPFASQGAVLIAP